MLDNERNPLKNLDNQQYIKEDCEYFIPNNHPYPLCRNYDCSQYSNCCLSENMIDEGGYSIYDK